MFLLSVNPATGKRLRSYRPHSPAQIEAALARAHTAFLGWRELSFADRARHVRAIGRQLRDRSDELAALMTAEMGKPIAQSRAEVEKCAAACDYYAKESRRFLAPEVPPGAPPRTRVVCEPLGVVLAIMPWNFPFWQVFRAAVPALMAGNTVVLKHSSNVSGCALAIAETLAAASVPRGIFQTLLVPGAEVAALIADDRVRAVTLTGSTEAGKHVAVLAGAALKPCVFELGGSDPYLVLADADLDRAAEICAQARLVNSGQSCIAAKRFIVVDAVRRAFEEKFAARLAARRVGDPSDPATDVGPLAREDLRRELHAQVTRSVQSGARLLLGGKISTHRGFYYPPTVLTDVKPGMPAYDQELFGPVAAIIPVRDEPDAVAAANDSIYGLGAAIFTRNRRRAAELAGQIDAGMVFVNDFVRSDVHLPFGGIKQSGYGRELGPFGLREFVNQKTLWGI
jgi:succinate-semialdehyde dehydrogenase / glutarate-semialdehyde dehydrogenase